MGGFPHCAGALARLGARAGRISAAGRRPRRYSTSPLTTSEDARFALTHLPNGIRVASLNTPGPCIAAGVLVELPDNQRLPPSPGTTASSFIMEKLAFKVLDMCGGDGPSPLVTPCS